MHRNKKGVMPKITREMYKNIKQYDRRQFQSFCEELYGYGYEDGASSSERIDLKKIYEIIAAAKGIGPKKYAELVNSIEEAVVHKK